MPDEPVDVLAVPVHDYANVFAEMTYHLFDQLTPSATSVAVLDANTSVDL